MKRCSYCGEPILSGGMQIPDGAATGAHAPAYWHSEPDECGPREQRPTGMDETSRVRKHLSRSGWRR